MIYVCWFPFASMHLSILWEVEHNWSRASTSGDIEGTANSPCHILWALNLVSPLGYRLSHTYKVYFLESIGAKSTYTNLTSYDHHWCRIHHSVSNTCESVGNTRTACYQADTNLATNSCKAFGSMCRSLLMTYEDMVEYLIFTTCISIQSVENRHDSTARIAEDGFNTFVLERAHQCLGACYYLFLCCIVHLRFLLNLLFLLLPCRQS